MAIMATATVKNSKALRLTTLITLLSWLTFSASPIVMAGKWQFTPNVGIEETYTDNVDLVIIDPTASFVSQAIVGLDADYQSRLLNFTFSGQNNSLFFSHDSDINDSYLSLETTMQYALGTSGLQLIAMANVDNTNRNAAKNGLANLVSGDTVQSETYASGLQYNVNNSAFSIASSIISSASTYIC